MSRSSKTLSRLGIAGVAAVTMGAGLPVFLASSAAAADATQLTLNPNPGKAAAGTCQVFTVDATDANGNPATFASATPTLTVQVSESPENVNQTVSFCDPSEPGTNANFTGGTNSTESTGTQTTAETAQRDFTLTRSGTVTSTTPTRATFGLRSNTAGGANIRAFIDRDGDNQFDAGELQVLGSTTFTAGGTNTADNVQGGNAAQDAVETITPGATNSPVIAGQTATATVVVRNAAGDTVSGVLVNARVISGPNGPQTASNGTTTPGSSDTAITDNAGRAVFELPTDSGRTGTDTVQFFVNQTEGTTAGPDAGEPTATTTIQVAPQPNRNANEARNINLDPASVNTVAGESQTFSATVTDVNARPVVGVTVRFTEEGPGRFANGSSDTTAVTDEAGIARIVTSSIAGESGTQIIVASIAAANTECEQAAGTGIGATSTSTAGNCSDTSTQTFGAASPSPSPSATTPPTSPSPSPTASASEQPQNNRRLTISVSPATITPGVQSVVRITGTPGSIIELQAYSRPSTTYVVVRRGTIGESGVIEFRVTPGTNTRLFAAVTGVANTESPSVVINVRTALSLTVVRNGRRDYTFQGRILPRRAGQLITLYRVTNDGREILTSQLKTDSTGTYRIRRIFTGSGTFGFLTRTGQTLTNAAGVSNAGRARPTAIF